MGISEMFIIILVYGGLFTYIWQMILTNTKIIFYVKLALLIMTDKCRRKLHDIQFVPQLID